MTYPARRVPPLKQVKTYTRSMDGWYKRNSFFKWYMFRETTCLVVGYYALILMCAIERLTAGEAAFNGFMAAMASPGWIVVNLLAFAAMLYHAWSWFAIMPKTLPFIYSGGKKVSDGAIVNVALAAAGATSLIILAAFLVTKP